MCTISKNDVSGHLGLEHVVDCREKVAHAREKGIEVCRLRVPPLLARCSGRWHQGQHFPGPGHVCHGTKSEGYAYKPFWESRFNAEVAKSLLSDHANAG